MHITQLYRYPMKGLSGEALQHVELEPGYGFPYDRQFALALATTEFEESTPKPLPKTKFLMLMKNAELINLATRYDETSGVFSVADVGGATLLEASLLDAAGKREVEAFFHSYLGDTLAAPPKLMQFDGHQFTDVGVFSKNMMHAISLINHASIRALENAVGKPVQPIRFRSNVYFDNDEPWSEFDWIGKTITLGDVPMEVVLRTRRCPATQVNPDTAERDIDVPRELKDHFGHSDMGIYAEIRGKGILSLGDAMEVS